MSLHSRLSQLTKRISHTQSQRQKLTRARRRLAIERMEDRRLLATIDLATLTVAQGTTIFGAEPSQQSGTRVGSAGDINGDGYDDLIISAPGGVPGATQSYAGGSYVVFGGPSIPATVNLANLGPAGIKFIGADAGDGAGSSVSGAGDVNGDGFDDIIIGAAGADAAGNGKSNAGESYLVFGGASLPGTINLRTLGSAGVKIFGAEANDSSGIAVSGAGDVNGDGYDDLIIGATEADAAGNLKRGAGESYVIFGRAAFASTINLATLGTAGVTVYGASESDRSGISVASAGDVNGDGFADVLISAASADKPVNANNAVGRTYVIFGAERLPSKIDLATLGIAGVTILGIDASDLSGISVSGAGDVNRDGFDDLIIGASGGDAASNSKRDAGESYVIFGSRSLPVTIDLATLGTAGLTIVGATKFDKSGFSVAAAGDVNGDGFDDLLIGAYFGDGPSNKKDGAGESYVVFGGASLPSAIDLATLGAAGITVFGKDPFDNSGRSVSSAGDVNGDGFGDLIIGAPRADIVGNIEKSEGESYVIYGGNGFTSSVTRLGTAASETLTGTPAAERFVGGRGNDTLIGNGGADVLIGGQGNDTLAVTDLGFQRVVGGTGADTLRLDGAGMSLDLRTLINAQRIVDVERINIVGTGDNSLTLVQADVLNISSSSNALTVRGNAGDRVYFDGGWIEGANETVGLESFRVFSQGPAILKVSVEVALLVSSINLESIGSAGTTIFGAGIDDLSGWSVSDAGDVNGDGFDDVIVGAVAASNGAGASYVVFGGATIPSAVDLATLGTAGIKISGVDLGDRSGRAVSSAGDVNGDGFDDLIIGAPLADAFGNSKADAGESYVVFGGASLPTTINLATLGTAGVTIFGDTGLDQAGLSVSSAGDVNGDGFGDLLIGAPYADTRAYDYSNAGKVYVIFGAAAMSASIDLATLGTAGVQINGQRGGDRTGMSVSSAGDVNGDGFDDLIFAAPTRYDHSGRNFILFGSPSLSGIVDLSNRTGNVRIVNLNGPVSSAGDVNGDGFDDVIIGAPRADGTSDPGSNEGASYVIFGRANLPGVIDVRRLSTRGITIFGETSGQQIGGSVSGAGDVNGDGFDDLLIGSLGRRYVVFGSASPAAVIDLSTIVSGRTPGIRVDAPSGAGINDSLSNAGDVNGDGFDDLIFGRPNESASSSKPKAGKSQIIFGSNRFTASASRLGTSASETLTGTATADIIIGGRGNDTLLDGGGVDVLIGGQGNDVMSVTSIGFKKVVGGNGSDTLRLNGSGINFDLTTLPDNRIQGIETIDLTGTGNNSLTLNQREVLSISDTTNILVVRRDAAGDIVNRGPGWTQQVDQVIAGITFEVFSQDVARLKIQKVITPPPVIGAFTGTVAYTGTPVLVGANATVTGAAPIVFTNGTLTFRTTTNGQSTDRLGIRIQGGGIGQIGVTGGMVTFSGIVIGTISGGLGTTPLVVTFNANATATAVQSLVRSVNWRTTSTSTLTRTVTVSLTDGDGISSTLQSKQITVSI